MLSDTSHPWGLGLRQGIVVLVAHNPYWRDAFAAEAAAIRAAIRERVIDLQHFGCTAIPGIRAKPILDLMLGIADFGRGPEMAPSLARLGYEYVPNAGVPDDHIFGKGVERTHLLHAVVHDGPVWRRNLRFRDRLRADPSLARAYETLKIELASQFGDSRAAYTAAKQRFIDEVVA